MSFIETLNGYIPELLGILCFIIGYIILTIFKASEPQDTATLSELIQDSISQGAIKDSLDYFDQYCSSTEPKDLKVFNSVLKTCQSSKQFEKTFEIFENMKKITSIGPSTETYEIVAKCFCEQKRFSEVIEISKEFEGFSKSEGLQMLTIESYIKTLQVDLALKVFEQSEFKQKLYFTLMGLLIRYNYQDRAVWLYTSYKMCDHDVLESVIELASKFECTGLLQRIVSDSQRLTKTSFASCIKTLVKGGQFIQGYQLLQKMNKSCFDEGVVCFYFDQCGKLGKFEVASELFQDFVREEFVFTVLGYNTLMDTLIKCQKFSEIWTVLAKMMKFECIPDTFTYSFIIKAIKIEGESADLDKVFDFLDSFKQKKSIQIDEILFNCLLDACVSTKRLDKALMLFKEMPKHDEISYNTIIKGYSMTKQVDKALEILHSMKSAGISPTAVTYNSIIDTCVRCSQVALAWEYLEEMQQKGLTPDNFTYSTLVKGIKGENSIQELDRIFKILEKGQTTPDEVLFNCLIDACSRTGDTSKCVEIFKQMQTSKIEASSVTYGIMIKAYGQANMLNKALETFHEMSAKSLKANDVTYGCLLDACVKSGDIQKAQDLFESMQNDGIVLNTILYTTMIKGFSKSQNLRKALELFEEMKRDVQPNNVTYNSLLDCAVRCEDLNTANQLFAEMQKVMQPDLISYSTMIKGLCKAGEVHSALAILQTMQQSHIHPDEVLFNSLLDGCAKLGNLEIAETVYKDMKSLNIRASNVTYSILIKLYGKNKQITRALEVLDDMKANKVRPGLIVYTCLLQACIRCKQIHKALQLYTDMGNNGVKGDRVTYNTLVNGCVYAKQLDAAYKIAIDSFGLGVTLAEDVYNNLLKNLVNSKIGNRMSLAQEVCEKMKKIGVEAEEGVVSLLRREVNSENFAAVGVKKGFVKKVAMGERNFNIRY